MTEAEMAHYRKAMPTPGSRRASGAMPGQIIGARVFFADIEAGLASLTDLPTLILWADRDPIFTAKYRKRWTSKFPGATTIAVEGAGHFLRSDAPEEFSGAVATWWAEITPEATKSAETRRGSRGRSEAPVAAAAEGSRRCWHPPRCVRTPESPSAPVPGHPR